MAEVTLSADIRATSGVGLGQPDPVAEAARRLAIQESMIAHMEAVLRANVPDIDAETAQIMARRHYFLTLGFIQACQAHGVS